MTLRPKGALAVLALMSVGTALAQQPETQFKTFTNSVRPLNQVHTLSVVPAAKQQHANDQMALLFTLSIAPEKQAELEKRVAKGEVISKAELQEKYSADAQAFQRLVSWLETHDFTITRKASDRTSVYARATVATIEKQLQVNMQRVFVRGVSYNAAQNAPKLPVSVGESVNAIIGLQPFRQAHKNAIPFNQVATSAQRSAAAPLGTATPAAFSPAYKVKDILHAYNGEHLQLTGRGQKIAILIDVFPNDTDLQTFWTRNGLSTTISQVEKVNVNQAALDSPSGEETLDAEWTTGLAPDAKIRIYASGTLQFTDLDLALDRLIDDLDTQPELHQLSISLGLGEQQMVPAEIDAEHARFVRLVALGVNVFVSSGDEGSHPNSALQVEYESSDPYVVAVGGTSMRMTATGAISDERGWNGSGGGVSDHFPRPAFQSGAGVPQGSKRCVPDVSLTADPNTGGYVVLNGTEQQYGGTSWSAPMWAAICALANEARANAGKPALPMVAPLLYPLNGGPCFRDITNGFSGDTTFSDYNAGPGYDLVTGLGVPDIKNLIDKLAQ